MGTIRTVADFDTRLDWIREAPRDAGTIELIVRRPAHAERETVEAAELDLALGLVGDGWRQRPNKKTGSPNPDQQLTLMSSRSITAIAGDSTCWPIAGDQLFVDFDLSHAHLPTGTQLAVGTAVVEITEVLHTGCAKFTERFGSDATRWVNSEVGLALRLRGVNAKVVAAGGVRRGDAVYKL